MAVDRVDRLNSQLRKNIYEILTTKVKNPNLCEMFSVVEVTCDRDLTLATVYISIFSGTETSKAATFEAIKQSAGFIRSCLAKMMRLHAIPQLVFVIDNTMQKSERINQILAQVKENDDDNH